MKLAGALNSFLRHLCDHTIYMIRKFSIHGISHLFITSRLANWSRSITLTCVVNSETKPTTLQRKEGYISSCLLSILSFSCYKLLNLNWFQQIRNYWPKAMFRITYKIAANSKIMKIEGPYFKIALCSFK